MRSENSYDLKQLVSPSYDERKPCCRGHQQVSGHYLKIVASYLTFFDSHRTHSDQVHQFNNPTSSILLSGELSCDTHQRVTDGLSLSLPSLSPTLMIIHSRWQRRGVLGLSILIQCRPQRRGVLGLHVINPRCLEITVAPSNNLDNFFLA